MTAIEVFAFAVVGCIAAGRIVVVVEAQKYRLPPHHTARLHLIIALSAAAVYSAMVLNGVSSIAYGLTHLVVAGLLSVVSYFHGLLRVPPTDSAQSYRDQLTQLPKHNTQPNHSTTLQQRLMVDVAALGIMLTITGLQVAMGWLYPGLPPAHLAFVLLAIMMLAVRTKQRFAGEVMISGVAAAWLVAAICFVDFVHPWTLPIAAPATFAGVWTINRWHTIRKKHFV